MNEPWTPGPWQDVGPVAIEGLEGDPIMLWDAERAERIAFVFGEANARLISLAPEMARVLQLVLDWDRPADDEEIGDRGDSLAEAVALSRDLLARARGQHIEQP